jgi:hypothetical protein
MRQKGERSYGTKTDPDPIDGEMASDSDDSSRSRFPWL